MNEGMEQKVHTPEDKGEKQDPIRTRKKPMEQTHGTLGRPKKALEFL